MFLNKKRILFLSSLVIFFASCTEVEYTNILDPKSDNYVGPDSAGDHDSDDIANIYDKDSPLFRVDKDFPVIELKGNNPDTLRYKPSEQDKFWERIRQLEKDFHCYDPSDKTINNDDVNVESNVAFIESSNYDIRYSVSDTTGNYTKVTRTIVVKHLPEDDVTPPSIVSNSYFVTNDTAVIILGSIINYIDYVNITDEDLTIFKIGESVTLDGEVNTNDTGVYKVNYTAEDKSGNKSSHTIYFRVTDEGGSVTDAVINVFYDGDGIHDGFIIEDTLPDVSFDLSLLTSVAYEYINNEIRDLQANLDHDYEEGKEGMFTATFSVTGESGTEVKSEVKIIIHGSDAPDCDTSITLELEGDGVINLKVGEMYEEPGFTATMTWPRNTAQVNSIPLTKVVNSMVKINPETVRTDKEGTITVTYEISTCDGTKKITKTRTVKVSKADAEDDKTPPVIKLKHSKDQDTVAVGAKYSKDYKSKDIGNTVTDEVDGNISWSKVKVDTSGFKTSEAGRACSLIYTVKNEAGNEGKAVRKITVVDKGDEGLLEKYGVPSSSPLPEIQNTTFSKGTVEGESGPDISKIKTFTIDWDASQKKIYSCAFQFDGAPWHADLTGSIDHNFGSSSPGFTLTDSGVSGLDDEYYVVYKDDQFIWVEKSGKFAIIWEE